MTPKRPTGADATPQAEIVSAPRSHSQSDVYAALDLGTNSCRMLIARPSGERFVVTDSFSRPVNLGHHLEETGRLSTSSMAKTISAMHVCLRKLKQNRVKHMRLVATEACRRASNGKAFISRIRKETGLRLEIISPEEEAQLAVVSCAPLVSPRTQQLLVVDIGGGSTELVWIDLSQVPRHNRSQSIMALNKHLKSKERHIPSFKRAKVTDWISIPLGVVTLRDQFMDVEDDTARFALMSCLFEEKLEGFTPSEQEYTTKGFQIIGTSGTITTVAASHLKLPRYDRKKVDGLNMSSTEIDAVIQSYLAMGIDGRKQDPRIGSDRNDLIMSGAAILQALMRIWPTDRLSVADRGLREGLLYQQMAAQNALVQPKTDDKAGAKSRRGKRPRRFSKPETSPSVTPREPRTSDPQL